jgi:hypothetical protein
MKLLKIKNLFRQSNEFKLSSQLHLNFFLSKIFLNLLTIENKFYYHLRLQEPRLPISINKDRVLI